MNLTIAEKRSGFDHVLLHPNPQRIHEDKRSQTDTNRYRSDDRAPFIPKEISPSQFDED